MVGVFKDLCGVPCEEYTSEVHLHGETCTTCSLGTGKKKHKAKRETARVMVMLVQTRTHADACMLSICKRT